MGIIKAISLVAAFITFAMPLVGGGRSAKEVMNQNMTINLSLNPHQINIATPLQDLWDHFAASAWPSEVIKFLYGQRYFIAGGAVLGCYVYMCRECARINNYLECPDSWGSWRKEYSLEMLLSMPQQQIARDLVIEIQRRYSNNGNPTDFIGPLILFCKTIDYEIVLVNRFISIYSFLVRSHLYVLFRLNIKKCAELGDTLKRLQFIKNIFLAWAADYKVEHNKRAIYCVK